MASMCCARCLISKWRLRAAIRRVLRGPGIWHSPRYESGSLPGVRAQSKREAVARILILLCLVNVPLWVLDMQLVGGPFRRLAGGLGLGAPPHIPGVGTLKSSSLGRLKACHQHVLTPSRCKAPRPDDLRVHHQQARGGVLTRSFEAVGQDHGGFKGLPRWMDRAQDRLWRCSWT